MGRGRRGQRKRVQSFFKTATKIACAPRNRPIPTPLLLLRFSLKLVCEEYEKYSRRSYASGTDTHQTEKNTHNDEHTTPREDILELVKISDFLFLEFFIPITTCIVDRMSICIQHIFHQRQFSEHYVLLRCPPEVCTRHLCTIFAPWA